MPNKVREKLQKMASRVRNDRHLLKKGLVKCVKNCPEKCGTTNISKCPENSEIEDENNS